MALQTDLQARSLANHYVARREQSGRGEAIDIGMILGIAEILIPLVIKCFRPDDGPDAQRYVTARYDASDDSYKQRMVNRVARQAKKAARQKGERITKDQAQEIAVATLDQVRLGDAQELSLVIREHD